MGKHQGRRGRLLCFPPPRPAPPSLSFACFFARESEGRGGEVVREGGRGGLGPAGTQASRAIETFGEQDASGAASHVYLSLVRIMFAVLFREYPIPH